MFCNVIENSHGAFRNDQLICKFQGQIHVSLTEEMATVKFSVMVKIFPCF